jgi:SAM-dependent methyltransferase
VIPQDTRRLLRNIPFVERVARLIRGNDAPKSDIPKIEFRSSPSYWEERYRLGGSSGAGSYGRLARFKAQTLNQFVTRNEVTSVVEFGCGDGAQLALANYPRYVGIDVSQHAVELCKRKFSADPTKRFYHLAEMRAADQTADLAMSLDVLYHLVEDEVYDQSMRSLAGAARRFICIYSSNVDKPGDVAHIRHRCFTAWIARHAPQWRVISRVPNPFPEDSENPEETSWADFYFFARRGEQN